MLLGKAKDSPKVKAMRLDVRKRMRAASAALATILDSKHADVEALRREVTRWQISELQEAERDVQSVIAGRPTTSLMGVL